MDAMPKWADVILIPVISILLAAVLSALVILAIGENPWAALKLMVDGALGSTYGWGYTIYYATNFIFTGLAVAIASQAKLFNIGGEGQALLGGLGVAIICLYIPWPHWTLALLGATAAAALFGAAWAAIPAFLQAKRGSHIVITTIMFNFIAAALLNYFLIGALKAPGMEPATAKFPEPTHLPSFQDMFNFGDTTFFRGAPANVTFFVAIAACVFVWALVWRTRLGYEIRSFGESPTAAKYAGINPFLFHRLTRYYLTPNTIAAIPDTEHITKDTFLIVPLSILSTTFIDNNECPPKSKKLSKRPTFSILRTLAKIPAIKSSALV